MRNIITPRFFGQQLRSGHWSTDGLVFFWRGIRAGNVVDESSYGNHGTIVGNPSWAGEGLDFDGAGDYAILSTPLSLSQFTLSITFEADDLTSRSLIGDHTDSNNYTLLTTTTQLRLRTDTTRMFTVPTMSVGVRYNNVYTRDTSNNIRCYLNAKESSTGAIFDSVTFSLTSIGKALDQAVDFDGRMFDVKIYNRALAAREILDLYRNRDLPIRQDNISLLAAGQAVVGANPKGPLTHPLYGPFAGPIAC